MKTDVGKSYDIGYLQDLYFDAMIPFNESMMILL